MGIETISMKQYIKKELEENQYKDCRWRTKIFGDEKYCHFLMDNCPVSAWSMRPTYFLLEGRSEFHRCFLDEIVQLGDLK